MALAEHRATMHRLAVIGALALAGCTSTAVSAPVAETTEAASAAPIAHVAPTPPPADATDVDLAPVPCPDAKPSATRWLDSKPHSPLGISSPRELYSAPVACCAPWVTVGSRWHTIDRYGAVVGEMEVVESDVYDVTGCAEPEMKLRSGEVGVGPLASVGGHWKGAKSAAWTPDAKQRAGLVDLAERVGGVLDDHVPASGDGYEPLLPFAERVIYFEVPGAAFSKRSSTRYAVVGGQFLMIGRLNDSGRWVLDHLEDDVAYFGWPNAYRVLAVLDLDRDDVPEIIVHEVSGGEAWSDIVLGIPPDHEPDWVKRVESVGGAPI